MTALPRGRRLAFRPAWTGLPSKTPCGCPAVFGAIKFGWRPLAGARCRQAEARRLSSPDGLPSLTPFCCLRRACHKGGSAAVNFISNPIAPVATLWRPDLAVGQELLRQGPFGNVWCHFWGAAAGRMPINHPHSALKMASPRAFIKAFFQWLTCPAKWESFSGQLFGNPRMHLNSHKFVSFQDQGARSFGSRSILRVGHSVLATGMGKRRRVAG